MWPAVALVFAAGILGCGRQEGGAGGDARPAATGQRPAPNPLRNAYFGDLHVHTGWSPDAFTQNVRTTPEDAYRFAEGEAIGHGSGQQIQLKSGPLDFYAVTDHSEYMGVLPGMLDPNNPLSRHPVAQQLASDDPNVRIRASLTVVGSIAGGKPIPEFVNPQVSRTMWGRIQETAERHYKPGRFTTFIGYEWTSNPNNRNLHRNVIFRGTQVTDVPFTNFESPRPEDLWTFMESARAKGIVLLAVPHNANYSDGMMFQAVDSWGRPIDRAYAERRMRNEPIVEITQIKGQSETHPLLSPNDEFANFEISDFLIAGELTGTLHGRAKGSYVRDAYRTGLVLDEQTGANPYKFGVIGSSDTHNSGGPYEENNYFGKLGREDGTPEARLQEETPVSAMKRSWGAGGLAGVWAEENTRESIYDALARKETFGTTGPRMRVRFFAGWSYTQADARSRDMVKIGYDKGVPMGGDLAARPADAKAPTFTVWAITDPNSGNLDRIQIVKGWSKQGQTFERVYDVAWSGSRRPDSTGRVGPVGNTVDVSTATYRNSIGAAELSGFWTDPEFDPTVRAFYYVRVLEIPTPRWSTYDAVKLGIAPRADLPTTIQERAYTSPVWYTPTEADRARGRQSALTVASVEAQGGQALSTEHILALVVGKAVTIKNLVTGQEFQAFYGIDGQRSLVGRSGFGSLHGGAGIGRNPYVIRDGRLESSLDDGSRFSSRIYVLGDRVLAAKSDEAGYVNYELVRR